EVERRVALQTAELRRLHSRSEKAFERQADALALISHEFRNPIFAILGHAELMTDGRFRDDDTGWAQEWGATIKGAAEELLRHVNDILEFSRSQASRERLALEAVDVVAQVSSLRPTFEALARRGELVLTVDAAPRVPEVRANADAVRDVALNLVSNAVKYTPPGGAVRITVRPDGDRVLLAVSDTGVGIPSAERRQIFEPFYRVEGVRAMHGQLSTGLGLALTQQLVKAMGGAVAVESEVGAGSTFTVSLRKAQARSRVKGGPKSNGSNGSNGSPATSAAARTAQTSQT
ncbi:MAG: HAMP domain-containing histidine kinase, partial [Actinobacteria bacterium]|nr:HAMP domain-containing histidine kinase [Actinomycetota bacterium]